MDYGKFIFVVSDLVSFLDFSRSNKNAIVTFNDILGFERSLS